MCNTEFLATFIDKINICIVGSNINEGLLSNFISEMPVVIFEE